MWSGFDWSCSMWKMVLRNLETSTVFMWYCIISGRGRFWSTAGRSFESRLHSNVRCRAVCSAFSGQVQSGVGAFFISWRYERKQPWFVWSCVRKCFGQTGRDILWKMEGINCLVWVCFWRQVGRTSRESLYVATRLRFCPEVKYQGC
jgi:hypothetical protein